MSAFERRVRRLREQHLARVEERKAAERAEVRKPYEQLTVDELRKIATYAGMEGTDGLKKSALIDALIDAEVAPLLPPDEPQEPGGDGTGDQNTTVDTKE